MLVVVVMLAFVVGAGMVMGGFSAVDKLPQILLQRRLDTRLQEVSQPQEPSEDTSKKLLVKVSIEARCPPSIASSAAPGVALSQVDRAVRDEAVAERRAADRVRAGGLIFALIAGVLARSPLALPVGAAVGFALPFVFLSFKRTRRMRAFEEQFPEGLDLISRA